MVRILLFATVLFTGAINVALAAAAPRLVGGAGDDVMVEYGDASMGSLVGGGTVMLGGGDMDRVFSYGRMSAQPGHAVTIIGGGDSQQVVELATPRG